MLIFEIALGIVLGAAFVSLGLIVWFLVKLEKIREKLGD